MSGHWVWAALGALAMFPLKKLWDWYLERFWSAFWLSFKTEFKKSPFGKAFFDSFYQGRAKKDAQIVAEHPELAKLLKCKSCDGKGCDDCGGTGWS